MSSDDLQARIDQARRNHQAAEEQVSEARSSLSSGDIAVAAISGGLEGFGGALFGATIYQNKPSSTGYARLGKRVPRRIHSSKWLRSFHIDNDSRLGQHFNADFGPLKRFNHKQLYGLYGWTDFLGKTKTLKYMGGGLGAIGLFLDGYHIYNAPPGHRSGAIGSAVGGLGGVATGAAFGSAIFPGIGTVIGGFFGGLFGSIGGEYIGDSFF